MSKAEHHYKAALDLDDNDHLAEYYMAMHYAETRRPQEAIAAAKRALELNPEHLSSLQIMALLLSGNKRFSEALELVENVLEEFPDNLGLMALKVRLAEVVHGGERALNSAKEMINQWQIAVEKMQAEEQNAEAANNQTGGLHGTASTPTLTTNEKTLTATSTDPGTLGYGTMHSGMRMFDAMSDKDSISLHAHRYLVAQLLIIKGCVNFPKVKNHATAFLDKDLRIKCYVTNYQLMLQHDGLAY